MPQLRFDEDQVRDAIDRIVRRTFRMDFPWDWPAGVAFYGVSCAYEATAEPLYLQWLQQWMDDRLADGLPRLSVNGVSLGHSLLGLYEATGEQRYADTAIVLAEYLQHEAVRFADGIFQHTVHDTANVFPKQAWVDTLMMAGLYLLRIGRLLGRDDWLADGLRQFHGHERLLQDPITHLYYHGWDDIGQNHMSAVYWARGNAWAALTMARALEHVDVSEPSYMMIEDSLRDQLSALVRLQSDEGLWHTVLDDPDTYVETSGSAGIAAALLSKGDLYNKQLNRAIPELLKQVLADGSVMNVSAGTAVMNDVSGYKATARKRVQGWGQGLALVFFSDLLKTARPRESQEPAPD
ncbi:glycoside hydrolase family 88 protein [Cohnella hongkongensis]|uniref:Glycoside hydrolase family 88 protein n=1 Tax=Cohnella hongkongensis TaxID=178337 RepID=A0ABV9FGF0_9BACL